MVMNAVPGLSSALLDCLWAGMIAPVFLCLQSTDSDAEKLLENSRTLPQRRRDAGEAQRIACLALVIALQISASQRLCVKLDNIKRAPTPPGQRGHGQSKKRSIILRWANSRAASIRRAPTSIGRQPAPTSPASAAHLLCTAPRLRSFSSATPSSPAWPARFGACWSGAN